MIRASTARAKAAGRRSSRFPVADHGAACGGAEGTAPYSGNCLWCLAGNHPSPPASCPEAAWTARSVTVQVLLLRQRPDDVLAARELADACGPHLPIDLSLYLPCAVSAGAGKGRRWSTVRCWSHRHTTIIAQEGSTTTGSTWTEDGKRLEAGLIVGWRRLCTRPPGRSGAVSPRREHHVCPHPVTREPSSSWRASSGLSGKRWQGRTWAERVETRQEAPGKQLGNSSFPAGR